MMQLTGPTVFLLTLLISGCRSAPNEPSEALRVMSYNIRHGVGNDGVLDLARAAAVIAAADPHVVTLQEVDRVCGRSGEVDQAAWLGEQLGMESRFGAFMEYDGGEYGMAILSRLPIVAVENHVLPPGAEPRSALAVHVRLEDGTELVVVGIHLYATEEERLCQARRLGEFLARETGPVILAGDFNSEPDSPVMTLLRRAWADPDQGADNRTFNSQDPDREIDHYILYRPRERFEVERIDALDEPVVSDHRPLVLELHLLE